MECFIFTCRLYGFAFLWAVLCFGLAGCPAPKETPKDPDALGPYEGQFEASVKGEEPLTTVSTDPRMQRIQTALDKNEALSKEDRDYFSEKRPDFDWTQTYSYVRLDLDKVMSKKIANTYMGAMQQDGIFEVDGIEYIVRNYKGDTRIYAPAEHLEAALTQETIWRRILDAPEESEAPPAPQQTIDPFEGSGAAKAGS
jgi:hypothetical protein